MINFEKSSIFALNMMEEAVKIPQEWNKFYLKDVSFVNLMTRRIFNVLIVANPYDAFMLEDDGRLFRWMYQNVHLCMILEELIMYFVKKI